MNNEILDQEHEANPIPINAKKSIKALIIVVIFYAVLVAAYFYSLNALSIIGNSSIDIKGWVIWVILLYGGWHLFRGLFYGIKSISTKENSIGRKYIGTFGSLLLIIATLVFCSDFLMLFFM